MNAQVDWFTRPEVWSYGVAAIAFAAFAIQLAVSARGARRAHWLIGAVALSALWAALSVLFAVSPDESLWRGTATVDAVRIGALLLFLALFLTPARTGETAAAGPTLPDWRLTALVAAYVLLSALVAQSEPPPLQQGVASLFTFGVALAGSIIGLVLTEQVYRRTPTHGRWSVKPLCLGYAGLFGFDLLLYSDAMLFRGLDPQLWAARGIAHALVIPLFGMAAARNRDWKLEVSISRGVMTGSTALLVTGVYLLVLSGIGYYIRYFGGTWGSALQAVIVFGGLLLLALVALSGTFRSRLRVFVAKNFFAYRYDYREEWLKFTRTFAALGPSQSVQEACIRALAELVESPGGALWLRRDSGEFIQTSRLGFPAVELAEPADGSIAAFLRRSGWVIDVEDAKAGRPIYEGLVLPDWLASIDAAALVVPLAQGEELIGFTVLAQPRAEVELDWEVTDLLKAAGRQAASYIAQLQSTEALLEARKFDSFNRMSAFVVHDLKNLVAQLQLLLRNAGRHIDKPEFRQDMLDTVEHVVERMNQLMLQLRSGATPIDKPGPVDLAAVARKVELTRAAGRPGLEVKADAGVIALGHEDRLERVIGHLVQNAFEAAPVDPKVKLNVYRRNGRAIVEVADNGVGMSPEFLRNQLFKPFQTTKAMGMGIGAYESQQYVTSLGGRIAVDSVPQQGTRVRVELPSVAPAAIAATEGHPA